MKIITNLNDFKSIISVLKRGGLVIAPSDTVYGLLVDATNESSVLKLIEFKNRPPGKPISVFISGFSQLEKHVSIDLNQHKLLQSLLPGPFTIILASKHQVSKQLESEKGTLGIRFPSYPFLQTLSKIYGKPITATSANISGRSSHYSIESLLNVLPKQKASLIDLIVDGGKLPRNKPSTIIDLTQNSLKILRQGDVIVKNLKTYVSRSSNQTLKLGEYLIEKFRDLAKNKPLIFIFEGELGVGKTILVKGMGNKLDIKNIISPTYVVYYEYPVNAKYRVKYFYHFDLYNIEEQEELQYLGIESYLKPQNILCFEWGEKTGSVYEVLKKSGYVIHISMKYLSETEREIVVRN